MSRQLRIVAVACLSLGLLGCGGSSAPTAGPTVAPVATTSPSGLPSTTPAASPSEGPSAIPALTLEVAARPTAAPTQPVATGAFVLGASVWWGGFEIALSGGTYDAVKHTLAIDASFTNTGTQGSELRQLSDGTTVAWNGQSLPGFETSGIVDPGATSVAQIQVAVPATFDLGQAVLTFGKTGEHQALVPLNGDAATSERPTALSITGKITMGKYVTYTITSALLVPASCSGYPSRIKYGPQQSSLISIVLFGTAASKDGTNYREIDKGYLVLPNGTKVNSVPVMGLSLPNKAVLPNEGMCFAVTPPFVGRYTLRMHEYRSNATGSLVLALQ